MLIFEDSCEEFCNANAFVENATAQRHRWLSTIFLMRNLFHQSKRRRDLELQKTHLVFLKYTLDVMQVGRLSAQLGFVSGIVDWYQDATSAPYVRLFIDLWSWTNNRLRYCTDTGPLLSKSYVPERLKRLKPLDDEKTNSLYSPSVPIVSSQGEKSFLPVLSKRVYPVSLQMLNISAEKKTCKA